jgi:hypothetical protein
MRPDWYATIVASERAVVWYKAYKILQDHGIAPIGWYCDALYYLSPHKDPEQAIPNILKPHSLGGYKHVWTLEVDTSVREILLDPDLNASRRIRELKKVGGLD